MKIFNIAVALSAIVLLCTACDKDNDSKLPGEEEKTVTVPQTLRLTIEKIENCSDKTKVGLSINILKWNEGDKISSFWGDNDNHIYTYGTVMHNDGIEYTELHHTDTKFKSDNDNVKFDKTILYYPADENLRFFWAQNTIGEDMLTLKVEIPDWRLVWQDGRTGVEEMPLCSVIPLTEQIGKVKSAVALLRVSLKGELSLLGMKLTGNNNEPLAGTGYIYPFINPNIISLEEDLKYSLTLNCGNGRQLNMTTATDFYFIIPNDTHFSKGFTIEFRTREGSIIKRVSSETYIPSNFIMSMPELTLSTDDAEVEFEDDNFKAHMLGLADFDNNGVITLKEVRQWNESTTVSVNADGKKYLDLRNKGIQNLYGIYRFSGLQVLYCGNNGTENANSIRNLPWFEKNENIIEIDCSNLKDLEFLNTSCFPNIINLDCSNCSIVDLGLSSWSPKLTKLDCSGNKIKELNVSKTNIGNCPASEPYALKCANMQSLKTLTLKTGWDIKGITTNRSTDYITETTEIKFVD